MKRYNKIFLSILFLIFLSINVEAKMQNINTKEEYIVKIAALTSSGAIEQLKVELNSALDNNMTINEINEVLIQSYAYCGFPRSLNAISAFIEVVKNRKDKGLKDKQGVQPNVLVSDKKAEIGDKTRTELSGTKTIAEWQTFAPGIEQYLTEHLFADIFSRGVLSHKEREIATVAMLASMKGVNPQLKAHIGMAKNTGVSNSELLDIIKIISETIGKDYAVNMQNILNEIK